MVKTYKLDHLSIEGYKSIQSLDISLGDINVFIGANGAGKSNFVSYFGMLREMIEQRLQVWVAKRGGADYVLTFGPQETEQLTSHLQFGDNGYRFKLEPTDAGGFVFTEESLLYTDKDDFSIGSGHTEARLKDEIVPHQWRRADYCYASIAGWTVYHFHDTSDTAGVKRRGELQDNKFLRSDASNLAAYLYKLKQTHLDIYEEIKAHVRLALPFFDDFILDPVEIKPDEFNIQLLWRQKNSDYPWLPSVLSDGSIRFICLTTALLQPDPPSTIIIDEPELGLHPYAITLLGAMIRSLSKKIQIIIATQSVPLLNEFSLDDIIVVEREDGVSRFERLKEDAFASWLEDYSVGELWEKNVLGGRP